ncbi:hypothetical protein LTS12_029477, partial [Elasticomyces elasticus]
METSQAPVSPHENVCVNRTNILHSIETQYEQMLLDEVPWYLNLLAEFAHWALLAGYLVIPGTFTSLQKSDTLEESLGKTKAGKVILNTIQNPPLVAIAVILFALGAVLIAWLFWERKANYIWLVNRLFIPTLLNAAAGLLTSLVNIYTAREGNWSVMALLTIIITSLSASGFLALVVIYKFKKLVR